MEWNEWNRSNSYCYYISNIPLNMNGVIISTSGTFAMEKDNITCLIL